MRKVNMVDVLSIWNDETCQSHFKKWGQRRIIEGMNQTRYTVHIYGNVKTKPPVWLLYTNNFLKRMKKVKS
jgi:hypothetical protein